MRRLQPWLVIATLAILFASVCAGQSSATKKSHMFHGLVEAVNPEAQSLRVNGEKVEGWMAAMTMDYKVDDPAVLKKVKTGDQIMATVYDGDLVLHKVEIMPPTVDSKTKK